MTEPITLTPRQKSKRAWREANKESIAEKSRAYRIDNKERMVETWDKWLAANKDKRAEDISAWREANPDYSRVYRLENPEIIRNIAARRRAGLIGEISLGWIPKLLELQRWTCVVCQKDLRYGYHIDHIYPVSKGGENVDYNLQALCPKCNLEKHDRDPIDFMQSRGFLL